MPTISLHSNQLQSNRDWIKSIKIRAKMTTLYHCFLPTTTIAFPRCGLVDSPLENYSTCQVQIDSPAESSQGPSSAFVSLAWSVSQMRSVQSQPLRIWEHLLVWRCSEHCMLCGAPPPDDKHCRQRSSWQPKIPSCELQGVRLYDSTCNSPCSTH